MRKQEMSKVLISRWYSFVGFQGDPGFPRGGNSGTISVCVSHYQTRVTNCQDKMSLQNVTTNSSNKSGQI